MSMYQKCRTVINSPFSTATNQPKIPDGAVPASMGGKRHMNLQIDFKEYNTYDIIISPRVDSPIYYASTVRANNTASPPAPTAEPANQGYPNFGDNHPLATCWQQQTSSNAIQINNAEISAYRIVSQGTRITLTNSTDDNDGWFEAFRFAPQRGSAHYETELNGTDGQPVKPVTRITTSMFGNRTANATTEFKDFNLASKSNYVTGKLRNLHRYVWTNRPQVKDVELQTLPTQINCGVTTVNDLDQNHGEVALQDNQYDCIWIRVHGRGLDPAAAGGCCLPTRLMIHCVQNIETVFGEQNLLHSFMTKSPTSGSRSRTYSLPYKPYGYRRYRTTKKRKTTKKKK